VNEIIREGDPAPATAIKPAPRLLRETFPVGMLQCNCTILADMDTHEAMVVDPGAEVGRITAWLAARSLKLTAIYITHAHFDHVAGAAELRRLTAAPIYLDQRDIPLLKMLDQQPVWVGLPALPAATLLTRPDVDAARGLRLAAGNWHGEVLSTPGHTPGSTCLYFAEQELLLAGDTLFAGGIGRTDLPGGNGRQILESLSNVLMPLPDSTLVVPGHGEVTLIGWEKESNPFLK